MRTDVVGIRAAVQEWMPDTVVIRRPDSPSLNTGTGDEAHTATTVVWSGNARVSPARSFESMQGGEMTLFWTTQVHLPWTSNPALVPIADDLVEVSTSDDDRMEDRVWRVVDISVGTYLVSRILTCVTLQDSGEWTP